MHFGVIVWAVWCCCALCVYYLLTCNVGRKGFQAVATTLQLHALLFLDKTHSSSPFRSDSAWTAFCQIEPFALNYSRELLSERDLEEEQRRHICLCMRQKAPKKTSFLKIKNKCQSRIHGYMRDWSIKCNRTKSQRTAVQVQLAYSHENKKGPGC